MPTNFLQQAKQKMPNMLKGTGGEANPPFLQARTFKQLGSMATKPIVSPKPYVTPNEVAQQPQPVQANASGATPGSPSTPIGEQPMAPPVAAGQPVQQPQAAPSPASSQGIIRPPKGGGFIKDAVRKAWMTQNRARLEALGYTWDEAQGGFVPSGQGGNFGSSQQTYDYLKGELDARQKTAVSNAIADAANRGVYYGTPLTTSQGDIETEFAKGQGALSAAMWEKNEQLRLQRLQLIAQLIGGQSGGSFDPSVLAILGQIGGNTGNAGGQ